MKTSPAPIEIIKHLSLGFQALSDVEVIATLSAIPPLADETDPAWNDDEYWKVVAIPLLLDRACFGDPGEIMRGLRHNLEAIVNPEWEVLAELWLAATASSRLGTKLWAIDQIVVLDDPRAAARVP